MQVIDPRNCLHASLRPRLVEYSFQQQSPGIGVPFRAREGRASELICMDEEGRYRGDTISLKEGEGRSGREYRGEFELDKVIMYFKGGVNVHCSLRVELVTVVEGTAVEAPVSEEAHEEEVID